MPSLTEFLFGFLASLLVQLAAKSLGSNDLLVNVSVGTLAYMVVVLVIRSMSTKTK